MEPCSALVRACKLGKQEQIMSGVTKIFEQEQLTQRDGDRDKELLRWIQDFSLENKALFTKAYHFVKRKHFKISNLLRVNENQ